MYYFLANNKTIKEDMHTPILAGMQSSNVKGVVISYTHSHHPHSL